MTNRTLVAGVLGMIIVGCISSGCVEEVDCGIGSYDSGSGLCWRRQVDLEGAKNYCESLGEGWRMLTVTELRAKIRGCPRTVSEGPCNIQDGSDRSDWVDEDCKQCAPQEGPGTGGCYWDMKTDGECKWFWSSSTFMSDDEERAWAVNFYNGKIFHDLVTTSDYDVCCYSYSN